MSELSLSDLANAYRFSQLPQSQNIEDRRGGSIGNTLADMAAKAANYFTGSPVPWHQPHPIFPSGQYGPDIADATDRIRLGSLLNSMGARSDAQMRMDAYFNSGNPSVAAPSAVLERR